ncbi:MAG: hypothetical protein KJ964_02085 [Verrucomicrobia bacterium]|nr:hypothetical protein [Verrucomicrobiota bacterium]MBU1734836.1 hypothetical protein [Verrucomicrobiota bacterium]
MNTNTISNKIIAISLSAEDGSLEKVNCGDKCWNGYSGGLAVIDELAGRIFTNATAETKTMEAVGNSKRVFEKSYAGADFIVKETWMALEDCLSWRVEVSLKKGCLARSIQVKQLFPYPYPQYKLNVWSANERFPCSLDKLGGLHLYYGDVCYGTLIPAVSLYDKGLKLGITLAKPFDLKIPRLAFCFKDYHSDGLEIETSCLRLAEGCPAITEVLIRPHEDCWRPGLAWLYARYPEYFNPPNPAVHNIEGGFMITNPFTEKRFVESAGKYKVKWAEIHNHFPYYGNYAPEEKEWESVIAHDYPEVPPHGKTSRKLINDHIDDLHKNGIKGLLYFQCAGDAYIPYAENNFTDAIARDCAGKIIPTWKECCFADASPGTSFGKHLGRQIDKFVNDYPEIDGVFLDQLCYQAVDTAHDDGITAYENKPAAMFGHSYLANLKKLSEILHGQGKIVWANGPFNIEIQKDIDGMMSEGTSGICKSFQYLCLSKPLLVHTYPDSPENVETMFKYCLLAGASYSIGGSSTVPVPPGISPDIQKLFDAYIPLVEKLYGRTWLLEPDPLEIPSGFQSNIFWGNDKKSVIVTLINSNDSMLRKGNVFDRNIKFKVKIKNNLNDYSEAICMTTHTRCALKAVITRDDKSLSITMPEHSIASVIIIR